jgi:alpha-tubulin suppressor-like RCC1 family protein
MKKHLFQGGIQMKKLLFVLLIALFIISGCGGNNNPPGTNPQPHGSLTLNIHEYGVKSQTIEPGLDMTISSYDIAGSGPYGTFFHKNFPADGEPVTINALAAGNWTITVDAKNADGVIIASGVATITVFTGVSTPVEITVKPLEGTGALEVGVSWPAGLIADPVVSGTLTPVGGSPMNISFILADDRLSATYQNPALPAGYYVLRVQLKDGTTVKWGGLESVRIITGQTAIGAFPLTAKPGSIGDIELIINPDLQNPITITFSGQQDEVPVGSEMTVTATTSERVDSYQWYINGTLLTGETGASITIGSSLAPGTYRMDLAVTKRDIVSTGYIVFTVGNSPGSNNQVTGITASSYRSLFLTGGGKVYICGSFLLGMSGFDAFLKNPVELGSPTGVTAFAAGDMHCLFLTGQTVWAQGTNNCGQLGNGITSNDGGLFQVNQLNGVIAVTAGYNCSLALKNDGTVWAWGFNNIGQLGNGTTTDSNLPVQVSGLTDVIAIATGWDYSLALKSDGTVWAWGDNLMGQLGNGTFTSSLIPVRVELNDKIKTVACGGSHCLALTDDGRVLAWGKNNYGQLGNGTTLNSPLPVEVQLPSGVTVTGLAGGLYHSLAICGDTVWTWGSNFYGQLGNGTNTATSIPVSVKPSGGVTVRAVAGGQGHSLALLSNGSVWSWGMNLQGQLGNGTTTDSNVPIEVTGF